MQNRTVEEEQGAERLTSRRRRNAPIDGQMSEKLSHFVNAHMTGAPFLVKEDVTTI